MVKKKKCKSTRKKLPKPLKTQEEKEEEIQMLKTKILSIGFPIDNDGIVELFQHFDNYIKDGTCWSGKIPLKGFNRVCVVRLTNIKTYKNVVTLKYDQNV